MFSKFGPFAVTTTLICAGAAIGAAADVARPPVWGPPATLTTSGGYPVLADTAISDDGDMAVAWSVDRDIQLALRPSGGAWGAAETVVADAESPQIEYDGRGRLLVAWTEHHPGGPARIKVRAFTSSAGWAAPRVVAQRARGPMMVADLDVNDTGGAVLAWTWLRRGLVSRGSTTGTWTTGLVGRNAARMDVALGDGGLAALTWTRAVPRENGAVDLAYLVARQPQGGGWGAPAVLQTLRNVGPPWPGAGGVTVDSTGHTTVAWQHRTSNGHWQVLAMRTRLGKPWAAPTRLATLSGWNEFPVRVSGNQRGDVLVSYAPALNGRLKGVHRPADGTWSSPSDIAGAGPYVVDWDAAMDPGGRAVALWSRAPGPGTWGRGAQVALMSRTGRWSGPERLTTAQTVDGHARRAAMNHGDVLTVWTRRVGDLDYAIVARAGS